MPKAKAKKLGRPKLPKGHAKGVILPVRLTQAEAKEFAAAAHATGHKTLSAWVRAALRKAASDEDILLTRVITD